MTRDADMGLRAKVRIVIADDHEMFVQAMRLLLIQSGRVEIVGCAATGEDLLTLIVAQTPDIALVDISMPGPPGEVLATQITKMTAPPKLIAVTMHKEVGLAQSLLSRGFSGFVIKDAAFEELLLAIDTVAYGESYISPALNRDGAETGSRPVELTRRESEVLRAAAQGLPNKGIALDLSISESTVKFHLENILRKLCARNRTEAIAIARRDRMIAP